MILFTVQNIYFYILSEAHTAKAETNIQQEKVSVQFKIFKIDISHVHVTIFFPSGFVNNPLKISF